MPDFSIRFPLFRVVKEMAGFRHSAVSINAIVIDCLDVVQQIIVDILHTQMFQLAGKNRLNFILMLEGKRGKLRRHGKAVSRIPLHHSFPGGFLTLAVVVDIAGVKVGISGLQENVRHLENLFVVKICGIAVLHRQTHHAESQCAFQCHYFSSLLLLS